MDIMQEALAIEEQVIAWQEHFHENAELSQKEEHTVAVIMAHLEKLGIDYVNVPDGGVLGFTKRISHVVTSPSLRERYTPSVKVL